MQARVFDMYSFTMGKISDYRRYRRGIADIADTFEHRKPKWELENGFIPEKEEKIRKVSRQCKNRRYRGYRRHILNTENENGN
ncbi:hypothetical protein INT45_003266 [Circinella minor]|uniref:Uncharacterized protein n=1 Tax=Circinella minor TaxID=1195481 RepID=A0A8H7VJE6_9FUNG|nr:hypothetical protein INT45_003266 [Circinella minor]